MIRKGFKEWVDAGFPTAERRESQVRYVEARLRRVAADRVGRGAEIVAKTLRNVAETYNGEDGWTSSSSRAMSQRWSRRCTVPACR